MVDPSQVDAVSGVKGIEGESIAPDGVDAGKVLRAPTYADNANAVQEQESIWFNDGSGPNPSGYYGFDGGAIFGPFGDVHNPAMQDLDLGGYAITNAGTVSMQSRSVSEVGARAYSSSGNQSVSNSTDTKVVLDTTDYDDASEFDTANSKFTAEETGIYRINAVVMWDDTIPSGTQTRTKIFKNGSSIAQSITITPASNYHTNPISTTERLISGDSLSMYVRQKSGGSAQVYNSANEGWYTYFEVEQLG